MFLELIFDISSSVDQATISILTAISSRTSKATMALPRDVSSSFSGGRVGLSDSTALRGRKRALRKDVGSNLKELAKVNQRVSATHWQVLLLIHAELMGPSQFKQRDIETQTTAVFRQLEVCFIDCFNIYHPLLFFSVIKYFCPTLILPLDLDVSYESGKWRHGQHLSTNRRRERGTFSFGIEISSYAQIYTPLFTIAVK